MKLLTTHSRRSLLISRAEWLRIGECHGWLSVLASEWPGAAYRWAAAGSVVDGRAVAAGPIPDTDSISASLDEWEELPGIREVPMSAFSLSGRSYSVSENLRIKELAEEIKRSRAISPLIVAVDREGPYILEGGHRAEALFLLGAQSFPALVVLDLDDVELPLISFPTEEIPMLQKRWEEGRNIVTTRVSAEKGRYSEGDEYVTPWGGRVRVIGVKSFKELSEHPYLDELTQGQRDEIEEWGVFDVVWLKPIH